MDDLTLQNISSKLSAYAPYQLEGGSGMADMEGLLFVDERPDSIAAERTLRSAGIDAMRVETTDRSRGEPPILVTAEGEFKGLRSIQEYVKIPREQVQSMRAARTNGSGTR